ncbi:hypothetical protein J421_0040 [Gemmatirosa kalamazoonensis]|uniref:Uncharacterized protein n=1 Tax=Gemmatirosa kalamazoonensis TaxID=861299 RepID=W0R9S9_9BACT|nr:hypothetical protein [Gemmatirosa kalamazoonensis]AHG87556.1 hypothetical protein J421_0018 [Gemmatirosa kalamazoonensis]AHG87577.1 hypothetical protein J421_0040 [Gemmatirosa kalamazoonensis]
MPRRFENLRKPQIGSQNVIKPHIAHDSAESGETAPEASGAPRKTALHEHRLLSAEALARAMATAGLSLAQVLQATARRGLNAFTPLNTAVRWKTDAYVRADVLEALSELLHVPKPFLSPQIRRWDAEDYARARGRRGA